MFRFQLSDLSDRRLLLSRHVARRVAIVACAWVACVTLCGPVMAQATSGPDTSTSSREPATLPAPDQQPQQTQPPAQGPVRTEVIVPDACPPYGAPTGLLPAYQRIFDADYSSTNRSPLTPADMGYTDYYAGGGPAYYSAYQTPLTRFGFGPVGYSPWYGRAFGGSYYGANYLYRPWYAYPYAFRPWWRSFYSPYYGAGFSAYNFYRPWFNYGPTFGPAFGYPTFGGFGFSAYPAFGAYNFTGYPGFFWGSMYGGFPGAFGNGLWAPVNFGFGMGYGGCCYW